MAKIRHERGRQRDETGQHDKSPAQAREAVREAENASSRERWNDLEAWRETVNDPANTLTELDKLWSEVSAAYQRGLIEQKVWKELRGIFSSAKNLVWDRMIADVWNDIESLQKMRESLAVANLNDAVSIHFASAKGEEIKQRINQLTNPQPDPTGRQKTLF